VRVEGSLTRWQRFTTSGAREALEEQLLKTWNFTASWEKPSDLEVLIRAKWRVTYTTVLL